MSLPRYVMYGSVLADDSERDSPAGLEVQTAIL